MNSFDFCVFQRGKCENKLVDLSVEKLGPIGNEMQRLMADPGYVDGVLKDGAMRANTIAEPILKEAHKILGFLSP